MTLTDISISRRNVIKGAAATALTIPFTFQLGAKKAMAFTASTPNFVNAYINISSATDDVTIYIGSTEMGQGIMTGMAQIVAEQLGLEWAKIKVEHGTPDTRIAFPEAGANSNPYGMPYWGLQITGGSTSTMLWYDTISKAAATVREMLIATANQQWPGTWSMNGNATLKKSGDNTIKAYRELVAQAHNYYFEAKSLTIPSSPTILTTGEFVGKSMPRLDIPAKLNGSAIFGIDINKSTRSTLTNDMIGRNANGTDNGKLYYAAVVHAPKIGGECTTVPTSTIRGVRTFGLKRSARDTKFYAVGVVSPIGTYEAFQAAKSIAGQISWTYPTDMSLFDSAKIKTQSMSLAANESLSVAVTNPTESQLLIVETAAGTTKSAGTTVNQAISARNDTISAFDASTVKINQTYTLPNLAHACMEVLNCTALVKNVTADSRDYACEIWAPTQGQDFCTYTAAGFLGCDPKAVRVNTTYLGGGLGRKIEQDYIGQAVQLSQQLGAALATPVAVKLVWQREQDFANDKYRPSSVIRVRMAATGGRITSYIHRNVSPSIGVSGGSNPEATGDCAGAVGLPYGFTKRIVENVTVSNKIPLGYWRSVGESYNTFAIESAIDELARACGATSYVQSVNFRLNNIPEADIRSRAVLSKLLEMAPTEAPSGSARGAAFLKGFGSYIALAIEVSGTMSSMRINRVFVALDCGLKINPDSIAAQVEGGVVHGLSSTLWGKMQFASGSASATNFDRYRLMRMPETPPVVVGFVDGSDANRPGGVGEAPVPLVAPALANAYARLLGTRKRDLPFN